MKPYGRVDGRRRRAKPTGTPVGRRVFLGMLGLGAAGIVWGAKVQSGIERLLRPITLNDRTGLTVVPADLGSLPHLLGHRLVAF